MGRYDEGEKREVDNAYNRLKLFSANCRSAKGKSTELTTMTIDYDVICLTETHVDDSIPSRTIISHDNLVFFRKDRNIYGGGVLVAVNSSIATREIKLQTCESEALFVRLDECMIICCYYRPHHSDDILNFVESFGKIVEKFPNDQVVLIGDMNFPGFDWRNESIKSGTAYKTLHENFLYFLRENNLTQIITSSTHVGGTH